MLHDHSLDPNGRNEQSLKIVLAWPGWRRASLGFLSMVFLSPGWSSERLILRIDVKILHLLVLILVRLNMILSLNPVP